MMTWVVVPAFGTIFLLYDEKISLIIDSVYRPSSSDKVTVSINKSIIELTTECRIDEKEDREP